VVLLLAVLPLVPVVAAVVAVLLQLLVAAVVVVAAAVAAVVVVAVAAVVAAVVVATSVPMVRTFASLPVVGTRRSHQAVALASVPKCRPPSRHVVATACRRSPLAVALCCRHRPVARAWETRRRRRLSHQRGPRYTHPRVVGSRATVVQPRRQQQRRQRYFSVDLNR
jgi:hypothetical protein